jgi:hypothetical protein
VTLFILLGNIFAFRFDSRSHCRRCHTPLRLFVLSSRFVLVKIPRSIRATIMSDMYIATRYIWINKKQQTCDPIVIGHTFCIPLWRSPFLPLGQVFFHSSCAVMSGWDSANTLMKVASRSTFIEGGDLVYNPFEVLQITCVLHSRAM